MPLIKPTTRDLRRINQSKALRTIYFKGPISRQQIGQAAQLSLATVTNVVGDLLESGVVLESGSKESDGGRPIALLTINPQYGYIIGIDVGETLIQVDLFDLSLTKLQTVHQAFGQKENQPEQVVDHIVSAVEDLLKTCGVRRNQVIGVGIGFPGLVDPDTGISIFAPNWGWHNVPLASILEERTGLPMFLDNGAKAMALAESMFGAGREQNSLAVLLVGTGVGAGIVQDGALYRGAINSAGECGHMTIEIDGRPCRCGSRGCLEAYTGAPGVAQRYLEIKPDGVADAMDSQMEIVARIIREADQGDPRAREVLDDTARYLGVGVGNLINLYNPQQIVLGGWFGLMLGERFLPEIRKSAEQYALAQPFSKTQIGLCQLGQEAVTQGAATLILQAFLESAGVRPELQTSRDRSPV